MAPTRPADAPIPRPAVWCLAALLALSALAVAPLAGCGKRPRAVSGEAATNRAERQRASQSNALFDSIKSQLRTLPESVPMDLRPPRVLLDSRTSSNQQDVEAVLTRRPDAPPQAPANQLSVPRRNARFRSLGVKPGDTVKYFVAPDRDTVDRLRETGDADIVTFRSIDLLVAQVLDDHSMLIVGGLPTEITLPVKIEIWRNVDDRMQEISGALGRYVVRRDPPLGWQPSPDEAVLGQMTERLNQWLRQGRASDTEEWKRPALIATLPNGLAEDPSVAPSLADGDLSQGSFAPHESRLLQEAVWARDVGATSLGEASGAAAQAGALFDWIVRHVQLIEEGTDPPRRPWQMLLHGRGTAEGRVWAFAQLCRQQGLTAVAVVVPAAGDAPERTLAGVIDGDQLLLFDPVLGLPLPGSDETDGAAGQGGAGRGVATLAQTQQDDALLRQLDLPDAPYPLTAERLRAARTAVIAAPFALTHRAALVERKLTGKDSLTLSVDADATAETLRGVEGVGEVSLWETPFRILKEEMTVGQNLRKRAVKAFLPFAWRPALWKGRVLHFRGRLEAPGAARRDVLSDGVNDHRAARQLYMDPQVRPKDTLLETLGSQEKIEIYRDAKALATYWLGTISLDEGDYRTAKRWLENAALKADTAAGWADGVRYNLARAYEGLGETERAAELLEADTSPQRHGNRLRARRLIAETEPEAAPNESPAVTESPAEAETATP